MAVLRIVASSAMKVISRDIYLTSDLSPALIGSFDPGQSHGFPVLRIGSRRVGMLNQPWCSSARAVESDSLTVLNTGGQCLPY
jgi:hypothetical protein